MANNDTAQENVIGTTRGVPSRLPTPTRRAATETFTVPTPFRDGIFSTTLKCAWCKHRSEFFFNHPNGGEGHQFHDWISARVSNRWQIICDKCNKRGKPPHSEFWTREYGNFPAAIWDEIVTYAYEACAKAEECAKLPDQGKQYTFQEHRLSYIHDPRMWLGIACPQCDRSVTFEGLCVHIQNRRRLYYREQVQLEMAESARARSISSGLTALGLTQQDVEVQIILASRFRGDQDDRTTATNADEDQSTDDSDGDSFQHQVEEEQRVQQQRARELRSRIYTKCISCDRDTGVNNRSKKCLRCKARCLCIGCIRSNVPRLQLCDGCRFILSGGTMLGITSGYPNNTGSASSSGALHVSTTP
jgi:hypothetical protein